MKILNKLGVRIPYRFHSKTEWGADSLAVERYVRLAKTGIRVSSLGH